jgi:mannose-1-phosphate guanylyltransferase
VVAAPDGRISAFQEKPEPAQALSNFASTGIYIFEPGVIDLIPSGCAFDIGSELFPLLAERALPFYAQTRAFNWIDIGSVSDYWQVLQSVLMGEVAQLDMPGTEIRDGLWVGLNTSIDWAGTTIVGPVYIGSGSRIEPGVTIIGPSWIGHGSHICEGAIIERSILFEYTRMLANVVTSETIVFKDYSVDRNGCMRHASEYLDDEWANARDRRHKRRVEPVLELEAAAEK